MNFQPLRPIALWGNAVELGMLAIEAQAVMTMRVMGMSGLWSVTPGESRRMLSEKAHAVTKSATNATRASLRGDPPDKVLASAIKPFRQKTRANARRLGKRGMKVT
ncbi:antifreeze protein [Roseobacter weihaiensis]|uniref:antifreeze protein n=1 Tax=Roseobacter weihaiensis TaxID=2763262 RepID=UPI001D0B5221|nr:antifreeze protein [Roseobacter sp. H9]